MLLNPLNWGKKRRDSQSVLDLDPALYDLQTHLPPNVQIGEYNTAPLVSLQDVHNHLIVLKAFQALSYREGTHFHRLADSAAFEYERWAQTVLPLQRRRRARRSTSTTQSMSRTGSGSGPASLPSPTDSTPTSTLSISPSESSTSHDLPRRKFKTLSADELPPLPVLMCWHAHMLNPAQFAIDTEGAYIALAGMSFPLAAVAKAIRSGSLPGEMEHVPVDAHRPVPSISGWMPPDISAAVQRQARIVGAIRGAGWLEQSFIDGDTTPFQRSIVRYHAWLDLRAVTGMKLAPTVDIELAWRTHQLKGDRYRFETQLILGTPLDQVDRGDELMLKRTAELWGKRFRGHDYLEASKPPGDRGGAMGVLKPLLPNRRSTVP